MKKQLHTEFQSLLHEQLEDQLGDKLEDQLGDKLRNQLKVQLSWQLYFRIETPVYWQTKIHSDMANKEQRILELLDPTVPFQVIYEDEEPIVVLMTWCVTTEDDRFLSEAKSAEAAIDEFMDFELDTDSSVWVGGHIYRLGYRLKDVDYGSVMEFGLDEERHYEKQWSRVIHPSEPDCTSRLEHWWTTPHRLVGGCKENPGVQGNGAGVIVTEVCYHCGTSKTTSTASQGFDTPFDHETITYVVGEYEEEVRDLEL